MSNWHRAAAKIVLAHKPSMGLSSDGVYDTVCACGESWTSKEKGRDEWVWANHVGAKLESQMPIGSGRGTRHMEVA